MRRRIIAISLAVVALIAGGVTIAVASSGNASTKVTKAQAVAYAHAVNLRASDLPPATEIQLLALLHSRAEAHKLN